LAELDEALLDLLRPLVREVVREEVERAQLGWRWVPASRAAELLGISENAVRRRVARGQLPGSTVDRRVYVDMESLDRQLGGRLR
jgi:hypothetical protein